MFTKDRIIPKVKHLKANFRKAIDSGRRSGGGKIVIGLYSDCFQIWSGSPAVQSVNFGMESTSIVTLGTAMDERIWRAVF